MEEKKLLKRKQKVEGGENRKLLAEACFDLGSYYNLNQKFERALKEYKESAYIYKKMGVSLDTAHAHRMVGEMYMMLGEFDKALEYEEIYLSLARKLDSKIEEQRAFATLGRAYLLQGQSDPEDNKSAESFRRAEKAFTKSLHLCESLKGTINTIEFMDMRARLLLNIGVVLENLGSLDKAIEFIQKAINISKCHDFHELLHQCYMTEGNIHLLKYNDHSKSLLCSNLAFETASRLENKVSKQCEALSLKADILCRISDFHSAKQTLIKAWKMKTPDSHEFEEIEKKLKIVAAMCYTEDLIITTDSDDFGKLKNLYEKLGDGACSLKNFKKGIDYYLKMLENAEKCGECGKQLLPIYISLYQTYADVEDYDNALKFYEKELSLMKDNPAEACTSYLGMVEILRKAKKATSEIETTLEKALLEAQNGNDKKLQRKVIKIYAQLKPDMADMLKKQLTIDFTEDTSDSSSDDGDKADLSQNTPNIGDDICIENLTDVSEVDDDENLKPNVPRRRGKTFAVKKNSKGETQLHQACISGNTLLVSRLIAQGHPINIRDNAGWLPLHEACIHGRKEIVEILIKNNAHINDRGGVQCDGITPMHDAAGNGHLEVVNLLLDYGASSSIKTDHGETVLDTLKQWRKRVKLAPVDQIFYDTLCSRLHKHLDKIIQTTPKKHENSERNLDSSMQISRKTLESPIKQCDLRRLAREEDTESDVSDSSRTRQLKRSAIVSDSSDDTNDSEEIVQPRSKIKKTGVSEYKNAINALRNRNKNSIADCQRDIVMDKRKKRAILDEDEVGEDWLDDDLKDFQYKKSRKSHSSPVKRMSGESLKSPDQMLKDLTITNVENIIDDENITSNNIIDSDNDFSDSVSNKSFDNKISQLNRKNTSLRRKWKHQQSLIKAGFTREKISRQSPHTTLFDEDSNDLESFSIQSGNITKHAEEPDSTSETRNPVQLNSSISETQITTSIRVKILDKTLLIPLPMEKLSSLTVNWLIDESSKRYYKLEGVKPVLSLLTTDGAILAEDDPLSIITSSKELHASVTNWNLPPLIERYVECCLQLQTEVNAEIKSAIECTDMTNTLIFSDANFVHRQFQPIFKCLHHQSTLTHLILDNNLLGNEGMVYLSSCLPTLKGLSHVDLRNNYIQSSGIKNIYEAYERQSKKEIHQELTINLNYNPIGTTGFIYILKLSKFVDFKQIYVKACDINEDISRSIVEKSDLCKLEEFDIGMNKISDENLTCFLKRLNPEKIISIKMEELNLSNSEAMQYLIQSSFTNLKTVDFSRCNLADSDVNLLMRVVLECDNIHDIHLCYNENLTFFSLKRLITHRPSVKVLDLIGCKKIFTHMTDVDLQTNWFNPHECKLSHMSLSVDKSDERNTFKGEVLEKMWIECFPEKGKVVKIHDTFTFVS